MGFLVVYSTLILVVVLVQGRKIYLGQFSLVSMLAWDYILVLRSLVIVQCWKNFWL